MKSSGDEWSKRGYQWGKAQAPRFPSPLHPTPDGNQFCPVVSICFLKKFNFEIILDWQESYKDSTDSSWIPQMQLHLTLTYGIIMALLSNPRNSHQHDTINRTVDLIQTAPVSHGCPFRFQDAIQHPTLHLIIMPPPPPPIWNTLSIFLCLSWPWQLWWTQVSYFVQSPSIWVGLMVAHD